MSLKNNNKHIIVILLTMIFICITMKTGLCLNQNAVFYQEIFTDSIYSGDIHTVLLRNASWELSLPVMELNSGQQLELLFDELSDRSRYLAYTLIHCDTEWRPSSISQQQYLHGFGEGCLLYTSDAADE